MSTSEPRRRALVLLLTCGGALCAQEPEPAPEPVDVAALVRRIRVGSPPDAELREIAAALLELGEPGARPLFNTVRTQLERRGREFADDAARLTRDVARAAPLLLRRRLGREGPPRVEALQAEVLERSRSRELSKRTIQDEIDPRIAELRALLVVAPDDVLAAAPKLREELDRLCTETGTLEVLFEVQEAAERVLLRTDSGRRHVEHHPLAEDPRGFADDLRNAIAAACRTATPMSDRDARVWAGNDALVEGVAREERLGVRALNEIRVLVGLPVLAIDVRLCAAARGHSADMARMGFFAHSSPIPGKESFGQRAALEGTSASAENIARGQDRGAGAIQAWWYSPGHHRNMMSGATRVGLGQHGDHWTQLLGG